MRHGMVGSLAIGIVLWMLLTTGTAFPSRGKTSAGVDYAFLVDNTGTMKYGERGATTLVALCRFVDRMGPGDRVSVFSYGEHAIPVLTPYPFEIISDASKTEVRGQLSFAFDADRTDITAGVELVWRERERVFPSHYAGRGDAVLVLLTDGQLIPVYDDHSEYDDVYRASRSRLRELARAFGEEGIPIHAVGVGSSDKIDVPHLKSIAQWSRGASYHVTAARQLPDVFAGIWDTTRPQTVDAPAEQPPSASRRLEMVESASAKEPDHAGRAGGLAPSTTAISPFDLAYRAMTGAVAVFLGLVVIGTRRKQPWAEFFTRAIGPQEQRVRGYLKPVNPPHAQMAHPIIGIENPGLPNLEIGHGTPYASFARQTLIEFVGTRDGTAPTIRVLRGEASVDGHLVSEERQLRDGEVLCFEGAMYMYLRGGRR